MQLNKGFSLIELLVVFTIIAILAIVSVPSYAKYRLRSKVANMLSACSAAELAVTNDYFNQGGSLATIDYSAGSQPFLVSDADFISSIAITNGTITVTGNPTNLSGNSINLVLVPTLENNEFTWTCYTDSAFFQYAPDECHNAL